MGASFHRGVRELLSGELEFLLRQEQGKFQPWEGQEEGEAKAKTLQWDEKGVFG